MRRMRRFLILLFVLLLPLQFAWAGAAAYCSHDGQQDGANAASAQWHFGHHSHAHRGEAADHRAAADIDSDSGKDGSGKIKLPDLDCAVCHFAGAQLVLPDFAGTGSHFGVAISYHALAPSFLSAPGATPDRPQWPLA